MIQEELFIRFLSESGRFYGRCDQSPSYVIKRDHEISPISTSKEPDTWIELRLWREDIYLAYIVDDYRLSLTKDKPIYSWMPGQSKVASLTRQMFEEGFLGKYEDTLRSYKKVMSPVRELALRAGSFGAHEALVEQVCQYSHLDEVRQVRNERWRALSDDESQFQQYLHMVEEVGSALVRLQHENLIEPSEILDQWLSIHDELMIAKAMMTS